MEGAKSGGRDTPPMGAGKLTMMRLEKHERETRNKRFPMLCIYMAGDPYQVHADIAGYWALGSWVLDALPWAVFANNWWSWVGVPVHIGISKDDDVLAAFCNRDTNNNVRSGSSLMLNNNNQ